MRLLHAPTTSVLLPRGRNRLVEGERDQFREPEEFQDHQSHMVPEPPPASASKWQEFLAGHKEMKKDAPVVESNDVLQNLNLSPLNNEYGTAFGAIRLDSVRPCSFLPRFLIYRG